MKDTPHKMIRSAVSFFSGTLLSRLTGLLRDMTMAFAFGTKASLAAFFVAFRFAHLLRRLLGEGSLQNVFIPQFESLRARENGFPHAISFFLDLYAALSLVLLLIIFLGLTLGNLCFYFYGPSWNSENAELLSLCLLMLPSLFFICLAGLHTALLQCERCYFLPAASPIAFNLWWILGALFLASLTPKKAMPKLAVCIVGASFFQWLVTLPKVIAILQRNGLGFHHLKSINPFSNRLSCLWKPFLLGLIGIGAAQMNSALDAIFARYAESSGPAYLWYAIRLQQLPLALFGIALSGALLPPLTRTIKEGNDVHSLLLLEVAIHRCLWLILPITAGLLILGDRCLDLLYGYGDFDAQSLAGTSGCLKGYTLGLIPMTLVLILAPLYHAREDYRIPTVASVISMILNMALNAIFVLNLNLSTSSIALATSISSWVNLGYLIFALDRSAQGAFIRGVVNTLKDIGNALWIACAVTLLMAASVPLGGSFLDKSFYLGILGMLFAGLFCVICFFLQNRKKLEEKYATVHKVEAKEG